MAADKFVIRVKTGNNHKRWRPTIWTRGPVSMAAAKKALARATTEFPGSEFRIVKYTGQKPLHPGY